MPLDYKISQVQFDVFHGCGGIVKVVVRYIQKMLEVMPTNVNVFSVFL